MPTCLIGLGANLGNRRETLQQAVELLAEHPRVKILRVSSWHETRPAGGPTNQPNYLNGAAAIETELSPQPLLDALHEIEVRLGRRRESHWAARTVDLDLLLYGDRVEQSATLMVPHPRMAWRRFVLDPATEIAPAMVHPVIGWTLERLLAHLDTSARYVAVTGTDRAANTTFARRIVAACSAEGLFDESVSTGDNLPLALECVRQQARLLKDDHSRGSRADRWTISDFWFGELIALAPFRLSSDLLEPLLRESKRLESGVVRPRLVVMLETSEQDPMGRAIGEALHRAEVGPVLRIAQPESQSALEEVVAAIQAME